MSAASPAGEAASSEQALPADGSGAGEDSGSGAAGPGGSRPGADTPGVSRPGAGRPGAGVPGAGPAGAVLAGAGVGPAGGKGDPWGASRYRAESVRLVLWRHGQTAWNAEGRFQGQRDIPLDLIGERQAERAARLLAALRPDAIYASDLARAMMTATPLARLTGLDVIPDKELRERHGGVWEGMTDAEIREKYPVEHAEWLPPGGESSDMVAERAGTALERIADGMPPGSLVVIVSHGAALRLGAARLLGFPAELWGAVGPLANCAWSVLGRRNARWRLLEHNAGTLPEPVLSDDR